jgi:hypothetical protein
MSERIDFCGVIGITEHKRTKWNITEQNSIEYNKTEYNKQTRTDQNSIE